MSKSYKRRRVAWQHFPDDQTLRLQTGAGEDDIIHLPSGLDRVDSERQEEEEEEEVETSRSVVLPTMTGTKHFGWKVAEKREDVGAWQHIFA